MKFVCSVCGYVHEGDSAPAECPVCHVGPEKFIAQGEEKTWAAEHVVGVASDVAEDIKADLRANFEGECSEVGMYLAMARVVHREGYPEIGPVLGEGCLRGSRTRSQVCRAAGRGAGAEHEGGYQVQSGMARRL